MVSNATGETMKFEIDSLDGIEENLQSLYEEQNGKYRLKVDGLQEFVSAKKKIEAEHREQAEKRAKALEDELERIKSEAQKAKEEKARGSGDVEALDKSWQEKYQKLQASLDETNKTWENRAKALTVNAVASSLANELAVQGSSEVLMPHIQSRLSMEVRDGQPVTVVLKDGKPSALTVDELKAEISSNPAFAPLIIGSKASGGGATGNSGSGASQSKKPFSEMSLKERAAYRKSQREKGN